MPSEPEQGEQRRPALVPEPTLYRLPIYLTYLKLALKAGQKYVSSTKMAREMGVAPEAVTKCGGGSVILTGRTKTGRGGEEQ